MSSALRHEHPTRNGDTLMATTSARAYEPTGDGLGVRDVPRTPDALTIKLGAIAGGTGVALQIVLGHLHPHHEQPNNSAAAFDESAHAHAWAAVHIGQFFGTLLIAFAMLVLCRSLAMQPGAPGALARAATVAILVVASVFAVQMAVDGIALKHAVDTWASATGSAKTSAFQVADGLRSLEKGLSAFFNLMNGTAVLALGLSLIAGRANRRWPGWIGILASIGFLSGGVATATGGFSPRAGMLLQPSLLLLAAFLAVEYVSAWRHDGESPAHPA
jgi:hypothetical protein